MPLYLRQSLEAFAQQGVSSTVKLLGIAFLVWNFMSPPDGHAPWSSLQRSFRIEHRACTPAY